MSAGTAGKQQFIALYATCGWRGVTMGWLRRGGRGGILFENLLIFSEMLEKEGIRVYTGYYIMLTWE